MNFGSVFKETFGFLKNFGFPQSCLVNYNFPKREFDTKHRVLFIASKECYAGAQSVQP